MFSPPIIQSAMAGIADTLFVQEVMNLGVGMATLGGYSLDTNTHNATLKIIKRGRKEFLIPLSLPEFNAWVESNLKVKKRTSNQLLAVNIRFSTSISNQFLQRVKILAKYVDVIEFNAHCRQKEIIEAKSGQYFTEHLDALDNVLTVMAEFARSIKIGVKIRGYKVKDKTKLVKIISDRDISYLHIDCMLPGQPYYDLKLISQFSELLDDDIAIIGNNSIREYNDIAAMLNSGASAVSLARPLIKDKLIITDLITQYRNISKGGRTIA